MPKKKFQNVRKHPRLEADYLLRYETGGGAEPRITNIKNFSAGGVKFLTREVIPESSTISMNILIPPLERSFRAHATVLRVRRLKKRFIYSVAVRFTDISKDDQDTLDGFIKTLDNDGSLKFLIDHANVVVKENSEQKK